MIENTVYVYLLKMQEFKHQMRKLSELFSEYFHVFA